MRHRGAYSSFPKPLAGLRGGCRERREGDERRGVGVGKGGKRRREGNTRQGKRRRGVGNE